MAKIFTKLNIGDTVASSGTKVFKKLTTEEPVLPMPTEAGLYDASNNLLASWDALVNTYGMNVAKNYDTNTAKTDPASPYSVFTNNSLSDGSKMVMADGVTSIGDWAFDYCNNLTSITIPDSITSIGRAAFWLCKIENVYITNLSAWCNILFGDDDANPLNNKGNLYIDGVLATDIVIPDGVTSINNYAFYWCTSLKTVVIPDGVTSIGSNAFSHCTNITNITIHDSVTTFGVGAFSFCASLPVMTIPSSVTTIGSQTFLGCTSITGIWVDAENSVYSSEEYGALFNKNKTELYVVPGGMKGSYIIPYGVTRIHQNAFASCESLTEVTVPGSVNNIDTHAFEDCTSPIAVKLLDGVITIGYFAFQRCELKSIAIPTSVTSIKNGAFIVCNNLTDVYYSGTEEQWNAIDIEGNNSYLTDATIHYNYTG